MYASRSSFNTPPSRRTFGANPARGSGVTGVRAVRTGLGGVRTGGSPESAPTPSSTEPTFTRTTTTTTSTTSSSGLGIAGNSPAGGGGGTTLSGGVMTTSKSQQQPFSSQLGSLSSQLCDAKPTARSSSVRRLLGGGGGAGTVYTAPGNLSTNISLDTAITGGARSALGGTTIGALATAQHLIPSIEDTYRFAKKLVPETEGFTSNGTVVPKTYVTIVFDLDETLCNNRRAGRALLRPGTLDLLRSLRAASSSMVYVEVILWTASMECVAKPVVERLDPHGNIFDHLIYRDRRWYKETGYTKDLRKLGRSMDRVVIMENSPLSVTLNRRNAILVKDFVGGYTNQNDQELVISKDILLSWISEVKADVEKLLINHLNATGTSNGSPASGGVSNSNNSTLSSCGLSIGSAPSSPTESNGTPQPPPSTSDSPRVGGVAGTGGSSNPRNNFMTPQKKLTIAAHLEAESRELLEQYSTAGPKLTDFLQRHPNISAGNELIARVSPQARNATVSGIVTSRASTEISPVRRSFPALGTKPVGGGGSPYSSSRRPLMYSR